MTQKLTEEQRRIKDLENQVNTLTKMVEDQLGLAVPTTQTDLDRKNFIEFGSSAHAKMLGLIPGEEDGVEWQLADPTQWGPAATPRFLEEILKSKIRELTTEIIPIQSSDPNGPGYIQAMWLPVPEFN